MIINVFHFKIKNMEIRSCKMFRTFCNYLLTIIIQISFNCQYFQVATFTIFAKILISYIQMMKMMKYSLMDFSSQKLNL